MEKFETARQTVQPAVAQATPPARHIEENASGAVVARRVGCNARGKVVALAEMTVERHRASPRRLRRGVAQKKDARLGQFYFSRARHRLDPAFDRPQNIENASLNGKAMLRAKIEKSPALILGRR